MPRIITRIRVPFADVDSSQRIHFTAMFRYFEIAEHALMRSLGFPYATTLQESAFPRVHLACDFHAAITYDMQLDVEASVDRVGSSSWTIAYTVRRAADDTAPLPGAAPGAVVASGRMTIVAMNPATERSQPIPDDLRRALTRD